MSDTRPVRVRFAPSPTGPLHIGGVRTALYNYLLAKKTKGTMILRIEDTDQNRFVPGAEDYIKEALEWIGIEIDESPWKGGPHAPYRQSERKSMYKQYAQQLLDAGHAYYAFDTEEELDQMRERLKAAKIPDPKYNSITRATMKNSLTLPEDDVKQRLEKGDPYVIRLNVPRKEEVRLNDMIRGWVMVHSATLDDKVLMKSDGMPTYHLANVVDDYLMEISHVIRGEEWLPSAPIHVLLYKFLGWESVMPLFAHLPLLLKPDGNGKLSKRDGDMGGYPVFPIEWNDPITKTVFKGFREEGYFNDAMLNFLAFLGWNPGTQQEIFSKQELIDTFTIERIGKSGTKFDIVKAKWYNQQYLKVKPDAELAKVLIDSLSKEGISCTEDQAVKACHLMKDRLTFLSDIRSEVDFFFVAPKTFDQELVVAKWNVEAKEVIEIFAQKIEAMNDLQADLLKSTLVEILTEKNLKIGKVLPALRLALTGLAQGPDLMHLMEIIGKQETLSRLNLALKRFN